MHVDYWTTFLTHMQHPPMFCIFVCTSALCYVFVLNWVVGASGLNAPKHHSCDAPCTCLLQASTTKYPSKSLLECSDLLGVHSTGDGMGGEGELLPQTLKLLSQYFSPMAIQNIGIE